VVRKRRLWVRLGPGEEDFVEGIMTLMGIQTRGEAIRFLIRTVRLLVETGMFSLQPRPPSPKVMSSSDVEEAGGVGPGLRVAGDRARQVRAEFFG